MSAAPPRLAASILRALVPAAVRDEAADELADLFAMRLTSHGREEAERWYRRQVLGFALRLRLATLRGGSLAVPPSLPARRERRESMGSILRDVRYAARALMRNRSFAAIAVLTLALGIGANVAIFSVVRSVLLRPLPFPEPDRLVAIFETRKDRGFDQSSFTHENFWDVRDRNRTLSAVGAITWGSMTLLGADRPERLSVAWVSSGFFGALAPSPYLGRLFAKGEDEPGADAQVALVSHALWTTRFGSDSAVLGRQVTLDGGSYRVVGVLPRGTPWLDAAQLFLPFVHRPNQGRTSFELVVVGRLAPGVTMQAAHADLEAVSRRIAEQYPEAKGMGVMLQPSAEWIASDSVRRGLWILLGSVGFLLLIACVNVVNLLLARATGQLRERALRAALGASRSRILQLALVEAALLGVMGGALGLALAFGVVRALRAVDPGGIPRLGEATIDSMLLALTLGIALFASIATGLVAAWRAPRYNVVGALRDGERSVAGGRSAGRLRGALVGIEVALSLILLVGAGLLVRSFSVLLGSDRGFATENRVMFEVGMPGTRNEADAVRNGQLMLDLVHRFNALPGIASAAAVSMKPLRGVGTGMGYAAADKPAPATEAIPWASWRQVTGGYFQTMGVRLLQGRDFTEQDIAGKPWRVIISERIARQQWPNENPLGRQLVLWKGQNERPAEVIGVASDMRDWGLDGPPSLAVYLPYYGGVGGSLNFVVHSSAPMESLVPGLRAALAEINPTLPLSDVMSLNDMVGDSVAARRFTMLMLAALAVVALLLALGGVYGVLSYTVSRRRSEMGMRMALGASSSSLLRLVMVQGMRPVVIGLVVGLAGAVALSRFMSSLLFEVTAIDLPTYLAVAFLLLAAAALSCYLPARDALKLSVVSALREE